MRFIRQVEFDPTLAIASLSERGRFDVTDLCGAPQGCTAEITSHAVRWDQRTVEEAWFWRLYEQKGKGATPSVRRAECTPVSPLQTGETEELMNINFSLWRGDELVAWRCGWSDQTKSSLAAGRGFGEVLMRGYALILAINIALNGDFRLNAILSHGAGALWGALGVNPHGLASEAVAVLEGWERPWVGPIPSDSYGNPVSSQTQRLVDAWEHGGNFQKGQKGGAR